MVYLSLIHLIYSVVSLIFSIKLNVLFFKKIESYEEKNTNDRLRCFCIVTLSLIPRTVAVNLRNRNANVMILNYEQTYYSVSEGKILFFFSIVPSFSTWRLHFEHRLQITFTVLAANNLNLWKMSSKTCSHNEIYNANCPSSNTWIACVISVLNDDLFVKEKTEWR